MTAATPPLRQQAQRMTDAGRHADAAACWSQWLAQAPCDAEGWYELGWVLRQLGSWDAALDAYAHALDHGVREPEQVHLNRAVIFCDELARDADAEAELGAALACSPDYLPALLNLGKLHEDQGRTARAIACYRQIAERPAPGSAVSADCWADALARLLELSAKTANAEPLAARAVQVARQSAGFGSSARANLWFALGRVREAAHDYAGAFEAFIEANGAAAPGAPPYEPAAATARIDQLIAASSGVSDDVAPHATVAGPEPVFICGMFRSGSTLVERVLGAHPEVAALGELSWFSRLAAGELAPYPARLALLDDARAAALAADYRQHLARLLPARSAAPRWVTDKRPDNFLLLALIKRLFPRARIVHTVRNPIDNGLSIWQQHLDLRVAPHAGDLAAIGHWYGQYQRLMQHYQNRWSDDLLTFDYDAFVADPEPGLRRLLHFFDLPWAPECLEFHQQTGPVKTASYLQVRRPLYRDASGRWRHYGERLDLLRAALASAGVSLPLTE